MAAEPTREDVLRACEVLLLAGHTTEALAVLDRMLGAAWSARLAEGARLASFPRLVISNQCL